MPSLLDMKVIKKRYLTKENLVKTSLMIVSLPIFIAFWWMLASYFQGQNFYYLPTPLEVWDALVQAWTQDPATRLSLLANVYASLIRFLLGFLLALGLAVPLGLLLGYSRYANALALPVIELLRPIPPIAWVPFLLLAASFFWGPILTIFIGVFFPVLSNVIFGVRSVDPLIIDAAKTQGANRWQVFSKVMFPSSIPYMIAGVKIGLGVGWMCIVAAEMLASQGGGVGAIIVGGQTVGRYDIMFAGMVTVAVLGILTLLIGSLIERRVKKWMGME
ncbi:MAG: taurine transporter subunit [Methanomassiliicoccales archaeon PtaU1.Bin030]|nr:MAG: taurine transporter subunit [Methanomassiliicoccales archaeon PtaU1.Bin030]